MKFSNLYIALLLLFLLNYSSSFTQSINFNLDLNFTPFRSYSSVFEKGEYQIVYAAPFASTQPESEFEFTENTPVFDQVRIARIMGLNSKIHSGAGIGFSISYSFKNDFQLFFESKYVFTEKDIFYKFQNMFINLDEEVNASSTLSADLQDNSILVSQWKNSYKFRINYLLKSKFITKPFLSFGYGYQFNLASTYSSRLKKNKDFYLAENSEQDVNEYYNSRVFQDKLFNLVKNESLNNTLNIGVGLQRFSFQFGIDYELQFNFVNQTELFYRKNSILLYIRYNLLSKNLIR